MVMASLASRLGIPTTDLWYASRGSGLVLLVVLSLSVTLGIVVRSAWTTRRGQRFVVENLHRNLALVAVMLLVVHLVTAELDPYVTIGWVAAVVPFTSPYRAVWIGLGALSLDILVAVVATSLVRRHLGINLWRVVHFLTYVAWPTAFVHSLESGNDTRITWVTATMWICAGLVALAIAVRLASERTGGRWTRRAVEEPSPTPPTVVIPRRDERLTRSGRP
jgi:sulfoxide reductase heme-binding subunit YedZ